MIKKETRYSVYCDICKDFIVSDNLDCEMDSKVFDARGWALWYNPNTEREELLALCNSCLSKLVIKHLKKNFLFYRSNNDCNRTE